MMYLKAVGSSVELDMDEVLAKLREIGEKNSRLPQAEGSLVQNDLIIESLMTMAYGKRFYLMGDTDKLGELWDSIRQTPVLADFYINCTRELVMHLGASVWTMVVENVITSLSVFISESSVIDTDTLSQFPEPDSSNVASSNGTLETMIMGNPWYVVIQLFAMLGIQVTTVATPT